MAKIISTALVPLKHTVTPASVTRLQGILSPTDPAKDTFTADETPQVERVQRPLVQRTPHRPAFDKAKELVQKLSKSKSDDPRRPDSIEWDYIADFPNPTDRDLVKEVLRELLDFGIVITDGDFEDAKEKGLDAFWEYILEEVEAEGEAFPLGIEAPRFEIFIVKVVLELMHRNNSGVVSLPNLGKLDPSYSSWTIQTLIDAGFQVHVSCDDSNTWENSITEISDIYEFNKNALTLIINPNSDQGKACLRYINAENAAILLSDEARFGLISELNDLATAFKDMAKIELIDYNSLDWRDWVAAEIGGRYRPQVIDVDPDVRLLPG